MITKLNYNFDKNQVKNLHYKDFSLNYLLKRFPHLSPVIEEINPYFKNKKYVTFDYQELNVDKATPTCKSPEWHTDGINNDYLIICWGDSRTEFIGDSGAVYEIDSQCLYQYTSNDIHRGRILKAGEYRVFLRVCFSDYIKPRNKVLLPENDLRS